MEHDVVLPNVDLPLRTEDVERWQVDGDLVRASAGPRTDFFIDPSGETGVAAETRLNATTLLLEAPEEDFSLSARVRPDFRDTFDAGVLMVWIDETHWAKLCFENSPQGQPMVVSVVTRGVADDANGFPVTEPYVWLRISRVGSVLSFHASRDGAYWSFVRAFALGGEGDRIKVGLEAQSPVGEGCTVEFDDVRLFRRTLADLRDGS